MRHSNQIGIFWQGKIRANPKLLSYHDLTKAVAWFRLDSVKEIIGAAARARRSAR
jgi:hypothetical protein